ncbi:hypothetical protein [Stieleria varia]|uniref:Uncharacterized protein n=1 Tax=Stieleria varia TaxID=2528005 RepID=A0A5C6AMI4_9BACT|nr:hypothetical protein [Stieleria varia]TWU01225.1 hypothetical protein Pla52n_45980 [Stieleria varia]
MSQILTSGSVCLVMMFVATAVTYADTVDAKEDSKKSEPAAPVELSVAPLDHVQYPETRPAWVGQQPILDDGPVDVWSVASSGYETIEECDANLKVMQRIAVNLYIQHVTGSVREETFPINDDWIENELITDRYEGTILVGDVEQQEVAVRLEFDQETRKKIIASYNNLQVYDRLVSTAVLIGLGFVLLICVSALLGIVSRRVQRRENIQYAV